DEGVNAFGSVLSYGWYSGYLGYALLVGLPQVKNFYGEVPMLMAQLELEYEDGSKEILVTDKSWKASSGPLLESDLLQGERYDARKELGGWDSSGYDDSGWDQVQEYDSPDIAIALHPGMPIREIERITPVGITPRKEGTIFNLGQNFAGIVELKVKGKAGDKLQLTYGEMLHPDGRLMTENLRMARATDTYILKGDPEGEVWKPMFTFHGFQYVQLSGYSGDVDEETVTGIVLSSDHKVTSAFECGSEMINQLYRNINWTQLSNFLDVPTDCPQRDERLGWTGDAQVYVNSAIFNRDVASFYTKWLADLNDDQWETGAYPNFAPTPYIRPKYDFSPGWMEAGIICPYEMYHAYGDVRILEKYWPNMEHFMEFLGSRAGDNFVFEEASFEDIVPKGGFGDWLSIGKKTPPDLMASFYYAYCAQLMSEMALAMEETEKATFYDRLFEKIREGTLAHYGAADLRFKCNAQAYGDGEGYVDGNLGFEGHTQTVFANGLYMGIFTPQEEQRAGEHLVELIRNADSKITAGFLGTKPMLPALSKTGYSELAYDLFLSTEYPSWGFEIVNGATTIWERWNSYTHEEGFGGERNAGMNSFNHYAFGAVCEWMFENAAGIRASAPAYRSITIKPETDRRLGHLKAEYQSISGPIRSSWEYLSGGLAMNVSVPVNVKAHIFVPAASLDAISEGEGLAARADGLTFISMEGGYAQFEAGSGDYSFFVKE
ncbi:MAG: family 78 glycoside hydrolase catalytic domain, partial [Bacteroidetes bacterium]|nr:family 78 glycoside hydrolase catalytic domain [Bacteroidota bacterium]